MIPRVLAEDRVTNQTAVAFKALALNGDRFIGSGVSDVEGVTTTTTNNLDLHIFAGAVNEERVVSFLGIYDDFFKPCVVNRNSTAKYSIVSDHEVFRHFSSDDNQCVITIATIDMDRSSFRSGDEVCSLTTIDVGVRCFRVIRVYENKQANEE